MNKILVVDNNPLMLEFMQELLSSYHYDVRTAEDGLQALHMVEEDVPDVLFIDLVMPQIDGKQLIKLLRAKPKLDKSHIVIISGIAAESGKERLSVPVDAHIAKSPFKKMRGHILQVLENFETGEKEDYKSSVLGCDELFQREITNELLYSKHHLEYLLSNIDDGFVELTLKGEIIYSNHAACTLTGREETKLITSCFPELFSREDGERIENLLSTLDAEPLIAGEEKPFILNGRKILLRFFPIRYEDYRSISVILQDITTRKEAEEFIKQSLQQKETLLREVHHRVKNNLSVIASLLSLQTSQTTDEKVKKHLLDSKNRVESMALVHERLYNSEDISGVDVHSYLEGITQRLLEVYQNSSDRIEFAVVIPDITVPMELAVPLGLIVNELVSNSLEHAFAEQEGGRSGVVEIEFEQADDFFLLHIRDNGAGLPENFDAQAEEPKTLGLLLVQTLAQQIQGSFSLKNTDKGTAASIEFSKDRWRDKINLKNSR